MVSKAYLIKTEDKHQSYNFLVRSEEERDSISLQILQIWHDNNYLEKTKTEADFYKHLETITSIPLNEIIELSKGPLKNQNIQFHKNWEKTFTPANFFNYARRNYNTIIQHNQLIDIAQESLKNKDGKTAWSIINNIEGGECMSIKIESFSNKTI